MMGGAAARPATCLVFAFGSNLDIGQMARRCPSAVPLSIACLEDHALVFVGASRMWQGGAVATVRRARGAYVPGLVYEMTTYDLAALDRYEGHPRHYVRRRLRVLDKDGYTLRAHVYALDAEPGLPSPVYYHRIAAAYDRLGFDADVLDAALDHV